MENVHRLTDSVRLHPAIPREGPVVVEHPCRTSRRRTDPWALPRQWALGGADLCLKGITAAVENMSEERLLRLAPLLGKILRKPTKRRTLRNMKLFLGAQSRSEAQWEQLWNAHTLHLGQTVAEAFLWQRLPVDEVLRRVVVRGEEHLHDALQHGRGVMLLANHLGNFVSMAPCVCRVRVRTCSSGNAMPTPYLERMFQVLLARFGVHRRDIGQGIPSAAAETFRRGEMFHAFVDLSLAGKRDEWIRLGPTETNVTSGPALLALRHQVPVLCVICTRLDAVHHEVTIHPPLYPASTGNPKANARQLTAQALEIVADGIRRHPEQWWQWDWSPLRRAGDGGHNA